LVSVYTWVLARAVAVAWNFFVDCHDYDGVLVLVLSFVLVYALSNSHAHFDARVEDNSYSLVVSPAFASSFAFDPEHVCDLFPLLQLQLLYQHQQQY